MTETAARTSRFQDDKFWAKNNSDRTQDRIAKAIKDGVDFSNLCSVCGAALNPATAKVVHVVDGGGHVLHPDDEGIYKDDGGDVGCWTVGPECARLVPAAYRAPYQKGI